MDVGCIYGNGSAFFIACMDEMSEASRAALGKTRLMETYVDDSGTMMPPPPVDGPRRVYFGNVDRLGSRAPHASGQGMGLIPGIVIHDGRREGFLEALKRQQADVDSSKCAFLYLEGGTMLAVEAEKIRVLGTGHALFIRSLVPQEGKVLDIAQYKPGEEFSLT